MMANKFGCKPSDYFDFSEDLYTKFCFDEACIFIWQKMENGEEPKFKSSASNYKSFADYYKRLKVSNNGRK